MIVDKLHAGGGQFQERIGTIGTFVHLAKEHLGILPVLDGQEHLEFVYFLRMICFLDH